MTIFQLLQRRVLGGRFRLRLGPQPGRGGLEGDAQPRRFIPAYAPHGGAQSGGVQFRHIDSGRFLVEAVIPVAVEHISCDGGAGGHGTGREILSDAVKLAWRPLSLARALSPHSLVRRLGSGRLHPNLWQRQTEAALLTLAILELVSELHRRTTQTFQHQPGFLGHGVSRLRRGASLVDGEISSGSFERRGINKHAILLTTCTYGKSPREYFLWIAGCGTNPDLDLDN